VSGERGEVPVTSLERPPAPLRDVVVDVKFKLSALWIATMFCYVYGDFFSLFVPGRIESMVDGRMGIGSTTPEKLLAGAVVMIVPSLMIVLSIVLRPRWSQWLNIVLGTVYTLMMLAISASSLQRWRIFYVVFGLTEAIMTLLIVFYAWSWPAQTREREE